MLHTAPLAIGGKEGYWILEKRKAFRIALVAAILLYLLPVWAAANGAMGPDMTIIVIGGPEDLSIDIVKTDGINEGRIHLEGAVQIGFERRYRVDYLQEWTARPKEELLWNATKTTLEVRGTGLSWDIPADGIEYKGYSHLVTLDVSSREVIAPLAPAAADRRTGRVHAAGGGHSLLLLRVPPKRKLGCVYPHKHPHPDGPFIPHGPG